LSIALGIEDFEAAQSLDSILNIDFTRARDQMIQPLERYFHQIILRIVCNAEQRQPVGLDLVT
jgi:hypothetical protein